jgi:hypothetical protein
MTRAADALRRGRPLFASIGVRIMLVAVVAMMLFRTVEPQMLRLAYELWALPSHTPTAQVLAPQLRRLVDDPELARTEPEFVAWLTARPAIEAPPS